jgi:hypothetical protein
MTENQNKPPCVYIAGPMTGLPEHNFPAFFEAAERFAAGGFKVVNPATNFGGRTDLPRESYLRADVAMLSQCDAIAMLPGWEDSRGARLEYLIARELGLVVFDAMTMKPLPEGMAVASINLHRLRIADSQDAQPAATALPQHSMPADAATRKERPITRGVLDYFPLAVAEVAYCSLIGNRQHNPGEAMHWAKDKSTDHADCIVRHLIDRGKVDSDGVRHSAKVAWRALAMLQTELEAIPVEVAQ